MSQPKSVQPRHFPPPIRRALAAFEALRRLGFSAGQIFLAYYPNTIAIILKQHGRDYIITCGGSISPSLGDVSKVWQRAADLWNGVVPGLSSSNRMLIFYETFDHLTFANLAKDLQDKGFECPNLKRDAVERMRPFKLNTPN